METKINISQKMSKTFYSDWSTKQANPSDVLERGFHLLEREEFF